MKKKLRSRRGETLTETLTSILVVALASVALATMVSAASKMNQGAKDSDNGLYAAVSEMEQRSVSPESKSVTVTFAVEGSPRTPTFQVDYYRDTNGLLGSYQYEGG